MTAAASDPTQPPRLSVVMPVRNLEPFVATSVESILAQTHPDFEFVIRDDGSTDGTREILRRFAARDRRIQLFESDESLGPAESSNWVVRHSRGQIVARMDGDDISHPERLARQIAALDRHPEASLVGTLWEGIDEQGRMMRPRDRWRLVQQSPFAPFAHGSIMFRREAFDRSGGYRAIADFWEDLDLYRRLQAQGELLVLPQALYQHRASPLSTRLASPRASVEEAVDRMYRQALSLPPGRPGGRLLPQVFLSIGSTQLWAGRRPRMFRRMLRRADLRFDRSSAAILAWALWGGASPRSLRATLSFMVTMRDRLAARRLPERDVYRWDCLATATPAADPVNSARPLQNPLPRRA